MKILEMKLGEDVAVAGDITSMVKRPKLMTSAEHSVIAPLNGYVVPEDGWMHVQYVAKSTDSAITAIMNGGKPFINMYDPAKTDASVPWVIAFQGVDQLNDKWRAQWGLTFPVKKGNKLAISPDNEDVNDWLGFFYKNEDA